jgi:TonB family protein
LIKPWGQSIATLKLCPFLCYFENISSRVTEMNNLVLPIKIFVLAGILSLLDTGISYAGNEDNVGCSANGPAPRKDSAPQLTREQELGGFWADSSRHLKLMWETDNSHFAPVTCSFRLDKDGKTSGVKLIKSSGIDLADQAAISAIEKASLTPPSRIVPYETRGIQLVKHELFADFIIQTDDVMKHVVRVSFGPPH